MTNEGEVKYEALSEKLGREASRILADQALQVEREGDTTAEMARLTLLAGQLMLIQWKVGLVPRPYSLPFMTSLTFRYAGAMCGAMSQTFGWWLAWQNLCILQRGKGWPLRPYRSVCMSLLHDKYHKA
jgi:hypothetical protein